jgi:hypothetical protein
MVAVNVCISGLTLQLLYITQRKYHLSIHIRAQHRPQVVTQCLRQHQGVHAATKGLFAGDVLFSRRLTLEIGELYCFWHV